MKHVLLFGLLLLIIACSIPRRAELVDGSTINVRYKWTKSGPVCKDSTGAVVQPYTINNVKR